MIPPLSRLKQPIAIRPEFVASQESNFVVRQQGKAASSTKFTIFTPEEDTATSEKGNKKQPPTTLISVDGEYKSPEERRSFCDASGLPLFDLYHSPRGTTWHIEAPGGNSLSIATLEPQVSTLKDDFKLQLKNAAAGGQDMVLQVQGQDVWKLRTHVLLGDQVVMTTKRLSKLSVYLPGTKVEWTVTVAEGFDLALASAIVVVMGATMYSNGRSAPKVYIG